MTMNDRVCLILLSDAENDIFKIIDRKTFDRERPYCEPVTTRRAVNDLIAHGFQYYTDFLKTGFVFYRVCHDAPTCPIQ